MCPRVSVPCTSILLQSLDSVHVCHSCIARTSGWVCLTLVISEVSETFLMPMTSCRFRTCINYLSQSSIKVTNIAPIIVECDYYYKNFAKTEQRNSYSSSPTEFRPLRKNINYRRCKLPCF